MTGTNENTRPFAAAAEPTAPELDGYDPETDPAGDVLARVEDGLGVDRAARALVEASRGRPDEVVPAVADRLSADDRTVRRACGRTLARLGSDRPAALGDAGAELAAAVGSDDRAVRDYALAGLASLADEAPLAARAAVDPSGRLLTSDEEHVSARATAILAAVATEAPGDVAPWLPELLDVVTASGPVPESEPGPGTTPPDDTSDATETVPREVRGRMRDSRRATERVRARRVMTSDTAAEAVALVTEADPPVLADHLSAVGDAVTSDAPDAARRHLLWALAVTAESRPGAVVASADGLANVLSSETDPDVLRQAAIVLGLCGEENAAAVADATVDCLPSLRRLATADEPAVRTAAVSLLSYVAEQRPGPVAEAVGPTLRDRAEDAHEPVRAGAVWCLRSLGGELDGAAATLRSVAQSDDDADVRRLARDAVESDAT